VTDDGLGFPEHRDTVSRLDRGVARVSPPEDLFDRILADTRPARPTPLHRRLSTWAAPVAAAAAAVLVTLAVTRGGEGLGDPAGRATIRSALVDGTVAVYRPEERDGEVVIDLDRVPDPPSEHYYELWIVGPGGRSLPIGAFTPEDGEAHFEVRLPTPGRYLSVDISIEEVDGPPQHSGRSIATARFN
jgi:anti-sigma-K factor RskA